MSGGGGGEDDGGYPYGTITAIDMAPEISGGDRRGGGDFLPQHAAEAFTFSRNSASGKLSIWQRAEGRGRESESEREKRASERHAPARALQQVRESERMSSRIVCRNASAAARIALLCKRARSARFVRPRSPLAGRCDCLLPPA